jgi:serine/threonine protein kinase
VLKLADFGTAKNMNSPSPFTNYVATRWYRPPEMILGVEKYGEETDVFALGLILAEFYNLIPLF